MNTLIAMCPSDSILQLHWGRYMCVMVAGFMENALQTIYTDYVANSSNSNVTNYANAHIRRIRNPTADILISTARAFNSLWGDHLRDFINTNQRRDALRAVMDNRHHIAHGRQSTVSVNQVAEYLSKCVEIIDFIESQCLGIQ
jgi:hypothetical protein